MTEEIAYHVLAPDTAHLLQGSDIFDGPVKADQLARFVSDDGHILVFATDGDRPVGFASGTILYHPDKAPTCFVNEVGVNDDWRRRGIATKTWQMLVGLAQDRGCEGVWLATEANNTAARALYRSLDARETSGVVVYDWESAMDAP